MSRFLVLDRNAPSNGKYSRLRRVAVLEVADWYTGTPTMISARARGVVRVVRVWEDLDARGTTERSAYMRALAAARSMTYDLTHDAEVAPYSDCAVRWCQCARCHAGANGGAWGPGGCASAAEERGK